VTVLADLIIVKGWPASGAVPHHDEIEHDVWIDVSAQQVVGEQRNSIVATTFTDALGDDLRQLSGIVAVLRSSRASPGSTTHVSLEAEGAFLVSGRSSQLP
jgi:hypothetical protein